METPPTPFISSLDIPMLYVISHVYSTHYDVVRRVSFSPRLDYRSGLFVGVAEVDEQAAQFYASREGFDVLSEAEYAALSQAPPKAEEATGKEAPADELDALSYNEVMALAKKLALDVRGKKPELIERIRAHQSAQNAHQTSQEPSELEQKPSEQDPEN